MTQGAGLGNKFLDDLRHADVLLHILDASGTTNEKGEETVGYDPVNDAQWLDGEIHGEHGPRRDLSLNHRPCAGTRMSCKALVPSPHSVVLMRASCFHVLPCLCSVDLQQPVEALAADRPPARRHALVGRPHPAEPDVGLRRQPRTRQQAARRDEGTPAQRFYLGDGRSSGTCAARPLGRSVPSSVGDGLARYVVLIPCRHCFPVGARPCGLPGLGRGAGARARRRLPQGQSAAYHHALDRRQRHRRNCRE